MDKRIGVIATLCALLMVGCAPAVQTPKPTHNESNAGAPVGGAGAGPAEDSVRSDEVTSGSQVTSGGEVASSVTSSVGGGVSPSGDVTSGQGGVTRSPPPQQANLDIYWAQPPECSIVAGGGSGGADGLTIFVGLRSGGETVTSLIPVTASTDSGSSSTVNAAANSDGSIPVQVNLAASDYGRTLGVTVTADPENTIAETDDSNNTLNITVDLPSAPASQDVTCRAS